MALVDELAKLHEVQKFDTQIYQREQMIKGLDSGDFLKQEAVSLMKRHEAAKAELQKLEAALRNRELELKSLEQKRAAVHEKLYSGRVTNPKELGDLEKDEKMLDSQIGKVEEPLLELMDQVERARAAEAELREAFARAKRKWQETMTRTRAETARMQKEIALLRPERERLATQLEKSLLRRYDEIRLRREGIGMAMTATAICPICHTKITPKAMSRLREGEELTFCENCARMLGWSAAEAP